MIVSPIKTRIFEENESLFDFIVEHIPSLKDGDILVITSKIVSLAEGKIIQLSSPEQKDQIIQDEAEWAVKTPWCWLTIKDGLAMPSAGVDESNSHNKLLLLPDDSYKSADEIRTRLMEHYRLSKLGIVITDSRTLPLRRGTIGVALGYSGIKGIKDYVGEKDLFGREFKMARSGEIDGLAAAAVLVMGEGAESQPLCLISEFDAQFTNEKIDKEEMKISLDDDMYAPLFRETKED